MILSFQHIVSGKVVGPIDVCIIGSGGGGSTMAYYLAKAGFSVVVLEKGGYFPPSELGKRELAMLTRIQALTILTPTSGEHTRVSLIAGECYGGGTLAAEGAAYDFPEPVKDDWEKLGLKSFSRRNKKLYGYMEELNKILSVQAMKWEHHNPNNQLLAIASEREGLKWKPSDRAVTFCMRCGNCTQGCRYAVKQDAANTFLTWAQEFNTQIFVGAKAEEIKINLTGAGDEEYKHRLADAAGAAREDILREIQNRANPYQTKFTVTASVTDRRAPVPKGGHPATKTLIVKPTVWYWPQARSATRGCS